MFPEKRMQSCGESLYHPEIDVLRFGAFFQVYIFHGLQFFQAPAFQKLGLPRGLAAVVVGLVHGGQYGVDLFFALSAYLITDLLLREHDRRKTIDIRAFYIRRILRIWPLYFLALFVMAFIERAKRRPRSLASDR